MDFRTWQCLFVGLILVAASFRHGVVVDASRPFSIFPLNLQKHGFKGYSSEIFGTLGIECKCCDHIGGKCTTDFAAPSCSNLHCSPWKQY